ncbi:MAG: cysteine--tRNA ligase [Candidatus Yanofskybacteria bacterium RIFCSPHIGHO2_01_FULL_45_42]|uniref:Cysteine--tRNA ligase n=3 Tax=Candidatus Yanofskyibacteriota TaxID=1752733 RepID=A0A1F8F288_9BACT|nr:MAG: cysteine--tRNA ligase [Candidatus Yanofskybacteria bacterium RIFCSPHIGHO2_01_FULL_45_42]OGN16043.1 MAG: cysteine--tRNA ligase [Candidatus Yanofskybacteria bacterium RIFCSPHIGHO2_02_FULL_46_19]OGN26168.1 MAG: cysteine--tRNA ligase [Candidatus Yanofskybacteria bacterium RIFCSPLOWO2_01_FULL_45_72]OGN32139.1 MAG: cysteine--tRNA ligase [Candidatus Yanofskybacteria bacterium RIFCSPLOWO2_02_FULL_45_18]
MIKISNTLTGLKEEFVPRQKDKIGFFVCGPTVYDYSHIGHAKTYIFFDVAARYLRHRGYNVYYLQNITDIDDKIISRAREEKRKPEEVAEEFMEKYLEDMRSLKVDSVSKYAKATKYIKEITDQIKRLLDKGYAYTAPSVAIGLTDNVDNSKNLDVYFDVSKFQEYGNLSKQNLAELESGTRVEVETNKRDPKDFVLWKAQNYAYEPSWKSPWGMGRPGWHIEDTAISEKSLGQQYDIHGGAVDLLFPHHEAEIAQMEALSAKRPFVKYWLHTGFLTVNGEKMSKSLHNFITIRDALKEHSREALRMMAIANYYRSPFDYKDKMMRQFDAAVNRLAEFAGKVGEAKGQDGTMVGKSLIKARKKFFDSMDDDFNTSGALAALFELVREINPLLVSNSLSRKEAGEMGGFLAEVNSILGIIPQEKPKIPKEVMGLVEEREKERTEKNWKHADDIRHGIEQLGYLIEDTSYGPYLKKK